MALCLSPEAPWFCPISMAKNGRAHPPPRARREAVKPYQWAILAVLLTISLFAGNSIPVKSTVPFWRVANEKEGVPVYLDHANIGKGFDIRIITTWTVDEKNSWRYADYYSAKADVDRFGGWVVPEVAR